MSDDELPVIIYLPIKKIDEFISGLAPNLDTFCAGHSGKKVFLHVSFICREQRYSFTLPNEVTRRFTHPTSVEKKVLKILNNLGYKFSKQIFFSGYYWRKDTSDV